MTQHRAGQRRGLGRGLGSLIPTAPPSEQADDFRSTTGGGVALAEDETDRPGHETGSADDGTGAAADRHTGADRDVEQLAPVDGAYFAEIPVGSITPNPRQPRQVFEEEALAELVHSVKEVGLLQPVVVRRTAQDRYELIMGERRWRATQEAGLATIPAIVRETSDDDMLRDALLENLHRSQLNPLEEAAAY